MKVTAMPRVSEELRKELVEEVKRALPAGVPFNILYGETLIRLEAQPVPSLRQARLLLQDPQALLRQRAHRESIKQSARQLQEEQIVKANIPKKAEQADHDRLVRETLEFLAQFDHLTPPEIKTLTILRLENGNRDPEVIPFARVGDPEALAGNLERHFSTHGCFVLRQGTVLEGIDQTAMALD